MVQFNRLPLYIPRPSVIIPPIGYSGKNICLIFFPENTNFLDSYRYLRLKPQYSKYVFVPTTMKPITRLTPDYRRNIINYKNKLYGICTDI